MLRQSIPPYFKARRDQLMKKNPGAVFILPASADHIRNNDAHHPYRQDSNLYYLCGFDEPDSFLVLAPNKNGSGYKSVLFVRNRDPEREIWDGERYGVDGALKVFGMDEAYLTQEFATKMPDLLAGAEKLFYKLGDHSKIDRQVQFLLQKNKAAFGRSGRGMLTVEDPTETIGELRLFKSTEEVALMRKACSITGEAHKTAMKEVRPGMMEYELQAIVEYHFKKNGCQRLGYNSIVAGGKNATCLHYVVNNEPLRDGEVVLIDAGGEYEFYSADITRTFPVGKAFTDAQAQVYEWVLKVQKAVIGICKPGTRYQDMHKLACEMFIDIFLTNGLMKGNARELYDTSAFKRFYPHGTGHWLGLDVHDVGLYKVGKGYEEPRLLEPGMVFTVEPGLYFQPGDLEAPSKYRNIGIRIEDDILITPTGCEILTSSAPKERSEIEALRR